MALIVKFRPFLRALERFCQPYEKALQPRIYLIWWKFCLDHQAYALDYTCSWNQYRISWFGYFLVQGKTIHTKISSRIHCKYEYLVYHSHRSSYNKTFSCLLKCQRQMLSKQYISSNRKNASRQNPSIVISVQHFHLLST